MSRRAPLPAFDWKDSAWTWAKFLEVGARLTKRSGDQVTQHAVLAPLDFRDYASYVYSNGGELTNTALTLNCAGSG